LYERTICTTCTFHPIRGKAGPAPRSPSALERTDPAGSFGFSLIPDPGYRLATDPSREPPADVVDAELLPRREAVDLAVLGEEPFVEVVVVVDVAAVGPGEVFP
jgi:hypothetical protein